MLLTTFTPFIPPKQTPNKVAIIYNCKHKSSQTLNYWEGSKVPFKDLLARETTEMSFHFQNSRTQTRPAKLKLINMSQLFSIGQSQ